MILILILLAICAWIMVDESRSFTYKLFVGVMLVGAYYYLSSPNSLELRTSMMDWFKSLGLKF